MERSYSCQQDGARLVNDVVCNSVGHQPHSQQVGEWLLSVNRLRDRRTCA